MMTKMTFSPHVISSTSKLRLTLRLLGPEHAAQFLRILQGDSPVATKFPWTSNLTTVEKVQEKIERSLERQHKSRYGIFVGSKLVGYFASWLNKPGSYGFAYFVAQDARGKGYAAAALQILSDSIIESSPAAVCVLMIDETNAASQRVAAKAGFHPTDIRVNRGSRVVRRHERTI
jgi:RimJ/RimL family protein N-acetyltransferase